MASVHPPIWQQRKVPPGFWTRSTNRRAFVEWLEDRLRIRSPDDWYQVNRAMLIRMGGSGILGWYRGSVYAMLEANVSGCDLKEWLFRTAPRHFWTKQGNRTRYLEWLGDRLGFEEPEDWYRITVANFRENKGSALLWRYGGSPPRVVMENFPEHEWCEWLFNVTIKRFWDVPAHRRRYLDWLGQELGFKSTEDWYQIQCADFEATGAGILVERYSLYNLLREYRPEFEWQEWKFRVVPRNFWSKKENRVRYLTWLGKRLGFRNLEDWYNLRAYDLDANYGGTLAALFRGIPSAIVRESFTEHDWLEWRFRQTHEGFWDSRKNRQAYLEWLGKRLGFKRFEDWYKIRGRHFAENHGHSLLHRFSGSPSAVVIDAMPQHDWKEWIFDRAPGGFWDKPKNRRRYLSWLGKRVGVVKVTDWRHVTYQDFIDNHGYSLLTMFNGSVIAVLKDQWPRHDWWKLRAHHRRRPRKK